MSHTTAEFTSDQLRTTDLTESKRYGLLSSDQRRLVLDILEGETTPVRLADLASEIAERKVDLDAGDTETVERVKTTLHHVHLPKLDEFGVLTYDLDSNQIRA